MSTTIPRAPSELPAETGLNAKGSNDRSSGRGDSIRICLGVLPATFIAGTARGTSDARKKTIQSNHFHLHSVMRFIEKLSRKPFAPSGARFIRTERIRAEFLRAFA